MKALTWLIAAAPLALASAAAAGGPDFLHQPERPATFSSYHRTAWYAPVRDGTRLAITVYFPDAPASAAVRFPVLLWYHPGHRESIDPRTGRLVPTMAPDDIAFFTGHGYAVAIAEMRGSGASFGWRELDRGPQIGRDGKDLVDWIAAQGWSDGKVGMIGASYQGFAQYAVAAQRPAALKAIFPEIAGFDDYTSMFWPGGAQAAALTASASASIRHDDNNDFVTEGGRPHLPSAPVIDEDGDGELADEIPLDRNGDGTFLDDGPPTYSDGKPRADLYYKATLEHAANRNLPAELVAKSPWRDSPIAGTPYRYLDLDPGTKPQAIAASGIAVYNRGGWFDYHARDTVMWQATLQGRTPSHLLMAPVGHGGLPAKGGDSIYRSGPYFAHFGDTESTNTAMNREKLAFFDHYLRGADNGFDKRPPVLIYVMGKGWRYEREWPLRRARSLTLSFAPDHGLSAGKVPQGHDLFKTDLTTSALSNGASRWNFGVSTARTPLTLDGQQGRRLSYTAPPLPRDTEVTGHPLLDVAMSSSEPDGDLFAYLEDVAPDGSSLLVTEGELRANYWPLRAPGGPVAMAKPALPWHGFAQKDYVPHPFAGCKVLRLRLDLLPTSWVFAKGHRIRLTLAAADWPSFPLHPALSPDNDPKSAKAPTWNVRRGPGLSALTLPIIPDGR